MYAVQILGHSRARCNNIPNSSTGYIPHHACHHSSRAFQHFTPFSQYGTTVNGLVTTKLYPRSEAVQYLYPSDHDHRIVENLSTRHQHKVRANDFRIYNKTLDPSALPHHIPRAFQTKQETYKRAIPEAITASTQPPMNPAMARKYPDHAQWPKAHDQKLDQLDQQHVTVWCYNKKGPTARCHSDTTYHLL